MNSPRHGGDDTGPGDSSSGPQSFPSDPPSMRHPSPAAAGPEPPLGRPLSSAAARSEPPSGGPSSFAAAGPAPTAEPPAEFADAARRVFGDRLPLAVSYASLLITDGVVRGLIGPREAPRVWERHLINCAVMSDNIPIGASVVDVGSGAGLPGIVLAVARPDLSVILVEPLARRTAFLTEAVTALGLDTTVTVVRARAEDLVGTSAADIVTARAVAPLDRLAGWCLPLAAVGGRLLALKGSSAADEVAEHHEAIVRLGGSEPVVTLCGEGVIEPPTTIVEIVREREATPGRKAPGAQRSGRSRAGRGDRGAAGRGRTRRR